MKLPASLLSQLRATVAVSAVLAAGCDLAATAAAEAEEPAEAEPQAQAAENPQPGVEPEADSLAKSFASRVNDTVDRTRAEPRALDPLPAAEPEDPTAFIPFSTDPAGPRVKPRAEAPLAFAEPPPKRKRRRAKPAKVVDEPCDPGLVGKPRGWDDCLGCGRG